MNKFLIEITGSHTSLLTQIRAFDKSPDLSIRRICGDIYQLDTNLNDEQLNTFSRICRCLVWDGWRAPNDNINKFVVSTSFVHDYQLAEKIQVFDKNSDVEVHEIWMFLCQVNTELTEEQLKAFDEVDSVFVWTGW